MTPTNDAPVTVGFDQYEMLRKVAGVTVGNLVVDALTIRELLAIEARHRLAALASAPAEPLPDIGPDPFKGPREDDRYEGSRLRLRAAYAQQQKGVPDQTALVWRYDLGTVLEMAIRLKSILADDEEPASAPAGDGNRDLKRIRTSMAMLQQHAEGCAMNHYGSDGEQFGMPGWLVDTQADLERFTDILARPRAAVGEQSREAIARIVDPKAWTQRQRHLDQSEACEYPDHADQWATRANDVVRPSLDIADAILALQSPPAKVEGV